LEKNDGPWKEVDEVPNGMSELRNLIDELF
jgi:hypothetical protein